MNLSEILRKTTFTTALVGALYICDPDRGGGCASMRSGIKQMSSANQSTYNIDAFSPQKETIDARADYFLER